MTDGQTIRSFNLPKRIGGFRWTNEEIWKREIERKWVNKVNNRRQM